MPIYEPACKSSINPNSTATARDIDTTSSLILHALGLLLGLAAIVTSLYEKSMPDLMALSAVLGLSGGVLLLWSLQLALRHVFNGHRRITFLLLLIAIFLECLSALYLIYISDWQRHLLFIAARYLGLPLFCISFCLSAPPGVLWYLFRTRLFIRNCTKTGHFIRRSIREGMAISSAIFAITVIPIAFTFSIHDRCYGLRKYIIEYTPSFIANALYNLTPPKNRYHLINNYRYAPEFLLRIIENESDDFRKTYVWHEFALRYPDRASRYAQTTLQQPLSPQHNLYVYNQILAYYAGGMQPDALRAFIEKNEYPAVWRLAASIRLKPESFDAFLHGLIEQWKAADELQKLAVCYCLSTANSGAAAPYYREHALRLLKAGLHEPETSVRRATVQVLLSVFSMRHSPETLDAEWLGQLYDCLGDADPQIRRSTYRSIELLYGKSLTFNPGVVYIPSGFPGNYGHELQRYFNTPQPSWYPGEEAEIETIRAEFKSIVARISE